MGCEWGIFECHISVISHTTVSNDTSHVINFFIQLQTEQVCVYCLCLLNQTITECLMWSLESFALGIGAVRCEGVQ